MLNYGDYNSFSDYFSDYLNTIERLLMGRKETNQTNKLNTINHLNMKLFVFVGIMQV